MIRPALLALVLLVTSLAHAETARFPTLSKLCDASGDNGWRLVLMNMPLGPRQNATLTLECAISASGGGGVSLLPSLVFNNSHGPYLASFELFIEKFTLKRLADVDGSPQWVLVASSGTDFLFVARMIWDLNSDGQPQMRPTSFTALKSTLAEPSGSYLRFGPHFKSPICAYLGENAPKSFLCRQADSAEHAWNYAKWNYPSIAGENFMARSLGWMPSQRPVPGDLERPEGRVDFQASLRELMEYMKADGMSDPDVAPVIDAAVEKIRSSTCNQWESCP